MNYLVSLLLLFAIQANATGKPEPPDDSQTQTQDMEQTQQQTLEGGDNSATGGSAEATGGTAAAAGGDVGNITTSINQESNAGNYTIRSTAPIVIGAGNTTAPCYRWFGLGLGTKDGNGGIGLPFSDKECLAILKFTILLQAGAIDAAIKEYCYPKGQYKTYGSRESCEKLLTKSIVPRETKEIPDETAAPISEYDDQVFREEVEAALNAVREELRQTKVEVGAVQKRSVTPRPDPYKAMHERVMAQTEHIK